MQENAARDQNGDTKKIAGEIEQNLNKMGLSDEEAPQPEPSRPAPRATADTVKFNDLQFGKNYNPVGK